MRVALSLCAAALIGAVALFSPIQAHADMTIVVQDDDLYAGWSKIYIAPNGRTKVYPGGRDIYVTPGVPARAYDRGPAYAPGKAYVAPNGRAPVYYGPPAYGGRDLYAQPAARVYGPQPVYDRPAAVDYAYGARAPVVVYDDRPPPWSREWYAYCTSKYRSFDPATGTFQPYHGPRQLCR